MKLGINEALNKAISAQKKGAIKEASQIYEAILAEWPDHPDANHNMAVLSHTIGNQDQAVRFFETSLQANPNVKQYWLSCINLLIKLERLEEAQKLYKQAEELGITENPFRSIWKYCCRPLV